MNKVFKVIWSKTKNCYVVASELAKSHTKAPSAKGISRVLVCGVLACVCSFGAVMPVFAGEISGSAVINGSLTTSSGERSSAWGWKADALGNESTAFGSSTAGGLGSTAWGNGSFAYGDYATTWGRISIANGEFATAWGYNCEAYGEDATAFGLGTHAFGNDSVAWGRNSQTGDYLYNGQEVIIQGYYNENNKRRFRIVLGRDGETIDESKIVDDNNGEGYMTVLRAIAKLDAQPGGIYATAFGDGSKALGDNSLAALGGISRGLNSTAIGKSSEALEADAVAIGKNAKANLSDSVALGTSSIADLAGGQYGYDPSTNNVTTKPGAAWKSSKAALSIGQTNNITRQIIGVAAGYNDTDAVNVAQLKEVVNMVNNNSGTTYTAGDNIAISNTDVISATGTGTATAGDTGLITGNTLYEALQNINIPEGTVYTAGNHISIGNDHSITAVVDGTVSSGNTGLVSGGQVYDAIQTIRPNIYIGGNGIVINGDTNTVSVKNVVMYDGDEQDTATLAGTRGTKLTNLKSADLSRTSMDAVNGNQLWTTNENIKGVKNSVNINTTNISALNTSMTNALESVTALGTLVDTIDNLKADASLNNLNDAGKQVIATAAANAVQEYMAGNSKVVPMNKVVMNNVVPDDWSSIDDELSLKADKDDVYSKSETDTLLDAKADVSTVSDLETNLTGNISALDERVTSAENAIQDTRDVLDTKADKDSVYTKDETDVLLDAKADKTELDAKADKAELEAKAEVDASNIDVDKWSEKLGTGEIAEGNTGLVNGGTVFEAMKNVGGNDMIKAGTDAIEIGSDAKYDGMDSVSIAKSDGTGRALRGVLVDPDDDTSAANVGYVNAVAENISTGVNQGFAKLDDKINKTGANAAALANLHSIADDGDTKWNVAAGFGRYHGESAGAVGLFYKPSDRVAMNISSTIGDDVMFGAGVSVAIDKPVSNGLSKVQMAKTINAQAEHIKQQDERIARLEAAMAQMIRNQK